MNEGTFTSTRGNLALGQACTGEIQSLSLTEICSAFLASAAATIQTGYDGTGRRTFWMFLTCKLGLHATNSFHSIYNDFALRDEAEPVTKSQPNLSGSDERDISRSAFALY